MPPPPRKAHARRWRQRAAGLAGRLSAACHGWASAVRFAALFQLGGLPCSVLLGLFGSSVALLRLALAVMPVLRVVCPACLVRAVACSLPSVLVVALGFRRRLGRVASLFLPFRRCRGLGLPVACCLPVSVRCQPCASLAVLPPLSRRHASIVNNYCSVKSNKKTWIGIQAPSGI